MDRLSECGVSLSCFAVPALGGGRCIPRRRTRHALTDSSCLFLDRFGLHVGRYQFVGPFLPHRFRSLPVIFSKVRFALRKGSRLMHVVVLLEASVSARVSCCWRSLSLGRVRVWCGYWSEEAAPDVCPRCLAAVAERVTESVTKQGFGVLFKTPRSGFSQEFGCFGRASSASCAAIRPQHNSQGIEDVH